MFKHIKRIGMITTSIISLVFTVVPESLFGLIRLYSKAPIEYNIVINRIIVFVFVGLMVAFFYILYIRFRPSVVIKRKNYRIKVSYGDIFKIKNAKKVIPFDECYTTSVGDSPAQVKPSSICGQYLTKCEESDIKQIVDSISKRSPTGKSCYNAQDCYTSGTIIPNGEYLLLAFAKLDSDGLGYIKYEEYLDCLFLLWKELDKYYAQSNICIPILGSGITRFRDAELTQQELLSIIIKSYELNRRKLKLPAKLHIICNKSDGFSLSHIE